MTTETIDFIQDIYNSRFKLTNLQATLVILEGIINTGRNASDG
jgi:Fe-S cluster assembly iron-binding protein IscA